MENWILKAQFTDRSGRIVYALYPLEQIENDGGPPQLSEGPAVGLVRMRTDRDDDHLDVEWFEDHKPQPEPAEPEFGPPRPEVPPLAGS